MNRTLEDIRHAGKKLRQQGKKWKEIAKELGIFTKSNIANPGLAFRIIVQGYIPKLPETQRRLGLAPICPLCKRRITQRTAHRKDLFSLSKKELLQMFENRQEMN